MGALGLALLGLALLLMSTTGWPTYAVLLGVSTLGVLLGALFGGFDLALLGSLPGRVTGVLEHDLLQALALYAVLGATLNTLGLADELYGACRWLLARVAPRSAPALASLVLGAWMAPMNGSVGASVWALGRSLERRAGADGLAPPRRAALAAVASVFGVVVPPSLVLLLLGDAMLRAHTEGLNLARTLGLPLAQASIRVVNTQDLMQAALLPALAVLAGWLVLAALTGRRASGVPAAAPPPHERAPSATLLLVPAGIVALLVLVALGRVRPVEAAATAALAMLAWAAARRQLTWDRLRELLDEAMACTGALIVLLLAATTFSLVLRGLGTDRLIGEAMLAWQGHPQAATLLAMAVMLAGAFVLDAFEMVFLVVPLVMPPLLAQVGDAAWVAVLCLMILQAGFLLPPFGMAVVLARGHAAPRPPLRAVARAIAPFLAWLLGVMAVVAAYPEVTRVLRTAPATLESAAPLAADELERRMREMSASEEPVATEPAPGTASAAGVP